MDTSKEYIQICDCEEIQSLRRSVTGDCYSPREGGINEFTGWGYDVGAVYVIDSIREANNIINSIWLPRQDQLQEMFGWTQIQYHNDFNMFDDYFENGEIPISWEKLWLKMYMKEKHNKTWDENKWI